MGYSQSMSRPSKLCLRRNGMAEKMKVCRANRFSDICLNLEVPNDQPPMARSTFNLGFLALSPTTL